MRLFLSCFISFLLSSGLCSSEIDSFTDRDPLMKDATAHINRIINGYFANALQIANKARSCDQSVVNKALNKQIRGLLWSPIENAVTTSLSIDKRQSPVHTSVYQDFDAIESPTLAIANLGVLFRLGRFYVGSDKLNHFLQLGYDLFERHHLWRQPLQQVIDWSSWTEATYYGIWTTGIYSYGDLASNYDGLLFWERVTGTNLAPGKSPYFSCKNNVWRLNDAFEIRDFVTAAWDEGINCNAYKTPVMAQKVKARVALLEQKSGVRLQCPIEPKYCADMIDHYGEVARHIITSECFL